MGPGQKWSPAVTLISLTRLSTSSICFIVSPNGAIGSEVVPLSLFFFFMFFLELFSQTPSCLEKDVKHVAFGQDCWNLPRDSSYNLTAWLFSGAFPAMHLTRCFTCTATVCIVSGTVYSKRSKLWFLARAGIPRQPVPVAILMLWTLFLALSWALWNQASWWKLRCGGLSFVSSEWLGKLKLSFLRWWSWGRKRLFPR